jgi:dTDP-4-dehydrorhamnose 3,5-epimerase
MLFNETSLPDAFVVDLEPHRDERGYLARAYCADEFAAHGLPATFVQANLSYNEHAGTVRGLHYQLPPATETKLVRCVRGALYDVIVDLRPQSPTYLQWLGVELTEANGRAVVVPDLFAHGFQALEPHTVAYYQASRFYTPDAERGLRPDDPAIGIDWPLAIGPVSDKDSAWPLVDHGWDPSPVREAP